MFLGQIIGVEFICKPTEHTVRYAEKSKELNFQDRQKGAFKFGFALAKTEEELIHSLVGIWANYCATCYWHPSSNDFDLSIAYAEGLSQFMYPSIVRTIKANRENPT
jgi:hypothetical protein